jgi:hypothetical protein
VLLSLVLHKHVPTHKGGGLHVQECTIVCCYASPAISCMHCSSPPGSMRTREISLLLSLVLHKGRMAIVKQLVESFADELSSLSMLVER